MNNHTFREITTKLYRNEDEVNKAIDTKAKKACAHFCGERNANHGC